MKVAIVHDWLTGMRGGERCLEAFLHLYPKADLFTLIHVPGATSPLIDSRVVETSFLNRIPGIRRFYRALLPLYPAAARSLRISGYDLVISLSHAAAKNVRVERGVPHVCYCFTPMRYIWDQAGHYFGPPVRVAADPVIRTLRAWDVKGADGVTHFIAISRFVAARIRLFYGRHADVICPPVRMPEEVSGAIDPAEKRLIESSARPFFLCAGALVPYKRVDVAVKAFAALQSELWIVGDGPERPKLERLATPNVRFLGRLRDPALWECYKRARALVFPGIEDFGIVPVECLASGRPVIGLDAGGLRDTLIGYRPWSRSNIVEPNACGVFIPKSAYGKVDGVVDAVRWFQHTESTYRAEVARSQALRFSYREFFASWNRWCVRVGIGPAASPALTGVNLA